ncbi:MAG TPA: hypothetical protein VFS30_07440 [Dehalococcoidia bacterium]|nr:hypothetical protein [Dehalococcoidia bacterium]
MSELLKAALLLAAFALVSVLVTAVAAGLALNRPSASHLTLETRSRLVADYSSDPLARRLQPLDPDVIRAAAQDEADLTEDSPGPQPAVPLSTATPVGVTPESPPTTAPAREATTVPTVRPPAGPTGTPAPRPAGTSGPGAPTSTLGPSPTGTPVTPTPTYTPRPTFTPTPPPTATPPPTLTPPPPTSTSAPTATPPPATNTPQPTATPKNVCDVLPLPPIPLIC